jgi:serine protease Do
VRDATAREAALLPGGAGQVITRFVGESPARRAGLVEGDVILKVDGVPTPGRGRLLRTIWSKRAGTTVTIDVWRRGQVISVGVTLGP